MWPISPSHTHERTRHPARPSPLIERAVCDIFPTHSSKQPLDERRVSAVAEQSQADKRGLCWTQKLKAPSVTPKAAPSRRLHRATAVAGSSALLTGNTLWSSDATSEPVSQRIKACSCACPHALRPMRSVLTAGTNPFRSNHCTPSCSPCL